MNMMYKNIIKEHYDELLAAGKTAYQRSLNKFLHEFIVWINPEGKIYTRMFEKDDMLIPRKVHDDNCCEIFDFDGCKYDIEDYLKVVYKDICTLENEIVYAEQRKAEKEEMLYGMMCDAIDNVIVEYLNNTKLDGGGERYDDVGVDDDIGDETAKLCTMIFNALEK